MVCDRRAYFGRHIRRIVLILVVVEDGLRPCHNYDYRQDLIKSLNPCCSGRWSATHWHVHLQGLLYPVLILVVVEDGLRQA